MNWLFKLGFLWICLDMVIIATVWYLITTIKPRWPEWWRRVIVDEEPPDQ